MVRRSPASRGPTRVAEGRGRDRRVTQPAVASEQRQPSSAALPIAFGPARSRRLGWSLGINNIQPKCCTYSCVYCQVGATDRERLDRGVFFEPSVVVAAAGERLAECRAVGQPVDYATFVPDGEPTLDRNLGAAIRGVASLGVKVAVLTNGSLLWNAEARSDLAAADWVSLKVDTVDEAVWRSLNRPVGSLRLETVLDGMRRFAARYRGTLVTETMLVAGLNDDEASIAHTARFVAALGPMRAYVAVPTRPPAVPWVRPPGNDAVRRAVDLFRGFGIPTACLVEEIDESERPFAVSTDPVQGLLGIVAVHPMTESAARDYLARAGRDWSVAQGLLSSGQIVAVRHGGQTYLRASQAGPRSVPARTSKH